MGNTPRQNHAAKASTTRYVEAERLRVKMVEAVREGLSIGEAREREGITAVQYMKWRERHPSFRTLIDTARIGVDIVDTSDFDGDEPAFVKTFFKMTVADFQLDFIDRMNRLRPGDILMALWPPEHGKTTTFENHASMKLAVTPDFRFTVGSESARIARKIIGRVKNRMEPEGSARSYVRTYGPFVPQTGQGRKPSQPWGESFFNVYKKNEHDERDYSMMAIGRDSSIVSTRTDHLHIDDVQSTKTKNLTAKLIEWFRQDALSRPGEHGITTIAGTRVCPDDFYEELENDSDLGDILHVVKYPAIVTDKISGEIRPLLPERYTMENLERMKRKVGQEAWDRNYMQNPGASREDAVFDEDSIEESKDHDLSILHAVQPGHAVYVTLDPALGGLNCVMALEVTPDNKLAIRWIQEKANLRNNEQIMEELGAVVMRMKAMDARVTDVVIETMNFQKGLGRDERLKQMKREHGFAIREHLTGWNKYDEQIGFASMATSFNQGDIILPYADDNRTRYEIDELVRQLKAWRNGHRGNRKRQDRIMALWFGWILWQQRHKTAPEGEGAGGWSRNGLPYAPTNTGLILPSSFKRSA